MANRKQLPEWTLDVSADGPNPRKRDYWDVSLMSCELLPSVTRISSSLVPTSWYFLGISIELTGSRPSRGTPSGPTMTWGGATAILYVPGLHLSVYVPSAYTAAPVTWPSAVRSRRLPPSRGCSSTVTFPESEQGLYSAFEHPHVSERPASKAMQQVRGCRFAASERIIEVTSWRIGTGNNRSDWKQCRRRPCWRSTSGTATCERCRCPERMQVYTTGECRR